MVDHPLRPAELRGRTPLRGVEAHDELGSTNSRALELAASPELAVPYLVVAERQTAGRGRGANRWWSSPGSLLFSLIADAGPSRVESPRRARVALHAGLAVCEALDSLVPGRELRVKWPNDVYLDGRKLCGILVEAAASRVAIGIGINVNNSTAEAPAELRDRAVSLIDAAGHAFDRTDVLAGVVNRLCSEVDAFENDEAELPNRWAPRCFLTGRIVRIEGGGQTTIGRCRGIDEEGALLLDTEGGPSRLIAGVVTLFE